MTGQQVGYLRVSTLIQNTSRQLDGVALHKVFEDKASGENVNRPQLSAFLAHLRDGDTGFINAELEAAGYNERLQQMANIVCTVQLAKYRFPGESASLDSLIQKSGNLKKRKIYSALEDAQILADIYFKLLANPIEKNTSSMQQHTPETSLPDIIPFVAKYAEHYLTLHKVHPTRTYNYLAREFRNQPVIEVSRYANKCRIGETWMYIAVPAGAKLNSLAQEEKLYVGAQTQDRMFRGDHMNGDNFHHAEMRAGNGQNNLISFLRSGQEVEVYRFSGAQMREMVSSNLELHALSDLILQPHTPRNHLGWWFEQYVLYREPNRWQWNTDPADKLIHKVISAKS